MSRNLPYIEPSIRTTAGVLMTLAGVIIYFFSEFTALALGLLFFVSLNLAQSGFTRFCLMEHILKRLGFRSELDEIHQLAREREQLQAEEQLLQDIDRQVVRSQDRAGLLRFVCGEISQRCGYPFVWIAKKQEDDKVDIAAWAGNRADYYYHLLSIEQRWRSAQADLTLAGQCIGSARTIVASNLKTSPLRVPDSDMRFGFQSIAAIPLFVKGELYGAVMLCAQHADAFDEESLHRLDGVVRRISVSLEMSMAQEQLQLLGAALASAGNGVLITDEHGHIQWVNESFTRLTGYAAEEAIGKTPALLKSGAQDAAYYQRLWDTLLKGHAWNSEVVERHKSGKLFTVQQSITPILDTAGRVTHFVAILDDISAKKEAAARIHYMAHFDSLTALPNRTLFYDRLHQVLVQAKRDEKISALLFMDLDRFKAVNDTLGHQAGDLLLKEAADRIKSCVRETDTVARLAGDEFTVLLPQVTTSRDAEMVAEKITHALSRPFWLDGHEVRVGSSIGIAFYPLDADNDEALIRCADMAMYAAKEQGRGTYCLYHPHPELTS